MLWVFFRANSVGDLGIIFTRIFTQWEMPFLSKSNLILFAVGLGVLLLKELKDEYRLPVHFLGTRSYWIRLFSFAALSLYIVLFGVLDGGQFLYFQF